MPALSTRRTYSDGSILFKADLDNIVNDIETLLNTTKLNDDNLQDQGITASSKLIDATVTTGKLAAQAVTTSKIAPLNVTTALLADQNVTTAKIADANVTTVKLLDQSVTTNKLLDQGVTTAKLADGAVSQAKRAALGQQVSASSGTFVVTPTNSPASVTNLSVTIVTTGRPVMVGITGSGPTLQANATGPTAQTVGGSAYAYARADALLLRNGSQIMTTTAEQAVILSSSSTQVTDLSMQIQLVAVVPAASLQYLDFPAAGTYTYTVQLVNNGTGSSTSARISNAQLYAFEL